MLKFWLDPLLARIYDHCPLRGISMETNMLDTLDDFRPEDKYPPETQVPSARGQSITIAELLSTKPAAIDWFEAIAISQAVCDTLRNSGADCDQLHIGPEGVSIDASGEVNVAAIRTNDGLKAFDGVAALLRSMLADTNIPTPLRLTLSQTSAHNSLQEWSKAIAYYERPNRTALIQALYQRAANSPSHPAVPVMTAVPAPDPPVPEAPTVRRVPKPWTKHLGVAAIAIGVSVISAAGVWVVQTRRPSESIIVAPTRQEPTRLNTAAAVVDALVNRIPLIGSRGRELDADPPALPRGRWIHLSAQRRPNLDDARTIVLPVTRSMPLPHRSIAINEPLLSSTEVRSALIDPAPARIYSVADDDVVPPVAVYPQFPSIPSGTDAHDVAEFDVVVAESGEVESVRARQMPASIADALAMTMSLSAAKTWRFRPGARNGQPVRYLTVVSILKKR